MTPSAASSLNTWLHLPSQTWALCYSTFSDAKTAKAFHKGCDAHAPTLTVVRNAGGTSSDGHTNPGNFVFGGYAEGPWGVGAEEDTGANNQDILCF